MSESRGKFVWYELMTSDPKAAESFYSSVIGWDAKDSGLTEFAYTILWLGSTAIGGLMSLPDDAIAMGAGPSWVGYVGVDDVDAYSTRVAAAGGAVYRAPSDIPGIGRFSVVADPHGATFVLFKGTTTPPAAAPLGTPGHIGWHELHSGDLETAFAFYSGVFGWTKVNAVDMGPMGIYQTFAVDGVPVGGMLTKMPETPAPFWLYYINVDAADAAVERATQAGAKVVTGPHKVPGELWIVQFLDPQGAMFAIVAPKR